MDGLTEQERKFIDFSITVLNTSKNTPNDIIYKEAQNKITSILRRNNNNYDELSFKDSSKQIQSSFCENNEELQQMREKLIKEYGELQKLIEKKTQKLQKMEEEELIRIIKEIDFKNYLSRYLDYFRIQDRFHVEAMQLLAALFGYQKAERELIKNGMMKK